MARILRLDRGQYQSGLLPLYRGDDWGIVGKLIDQLPGNYNQDIDLTGLGATAWFPPDPAQTAATGIAASVVITNAKAGEIVISLPASGSPGTSQTGVNPQGVPIYVTTQGASGGPTQTYATDDAPVAIVDRGFTQF